jgi:hypothetical protein
MWLLALQQWLLTSASQVKLPSPTIHRKKESKRFGFREDVSGMKRNPRMDLDKNSGQ